MILIFSDKNGVFSRAWRDNHVVRIMCVAILLSGLVEKREFATKRLYEKQIPNQAENQ